ncbi:DUF4041 domain-containing protein [Alloscardovia sp. HMSC034E08]|uniref:DUF4041 domain-containing protein n=1 Tax=Alloscardovia sp. HMSC034E08 TaxID=1739413 RepID=UPI0008B6CEBF|nr:DUF4041 domain-containing protein [Alloscardovia sp. HMSC034E08]OFR01274.1 hypothetical protein HMPREF2909_00040 [Alloscardovia sp. HMSC034E08]
MIQRDQNGNAFIPFFGRKKFIQELNDESNFYRSEAEKYRQQAETLGMLTIQEREEKINKLEEKIKRLENEAQNIIGPANNEAVKRERDAKIAEKRYEALKKKIEELQGVGAQFDVSLYDFDNPAQNSVEYAAKLTELKAQQKQMIKEGKATSSITSFTFNGKKSDGTKFINQLSKLALNLFNSETENAVKTVKAGNLSSAVARIIKSAENVSKFGTLINLRITPAYQKLKVEELETTALYLQAVQVEKEAERERKAELREQAKVQKELEKEMERLKKEKEHYENALKAVEERGDLEEAEKLRNKLEQIQKSVDDVDYRAANIRAGYVYVISNIGAFGKDVVKIGMTRRLEPMDRIRELSSASVPFVFDVHALFFSKDAVNLETMLHHEFEGRRVNKVNARKEFYKVTPQEVLDKLKEKDVALVEYKVEPEAEEYKLSLNAKSTTQEENS